MAGKYHIFQVAKWFLAKDPMTQKRLQKLCYYSQAWYFTLKESALVKNDFEAWVHGPVSSTLRNKLKRTGLYDIELGKYFNNVSDINDPDDVELLELVWNTYGGLTANALEVLTHNEDPWKKARLGLKPTDNSNRIISLEHMKEFYKTIYIGDDEYGA